MKSTITLVLFSLIALASCKKEDLAEKVTNERKQETINPAMTETHIHTSSFYEDYDNRGCSFDGVKSDYSWELDYRLANGYKDQNEVFYPIEKKWSVNGLVGEYEESYLIETITKWNKNIDWTKTEQLYRYDPNTQSAYVYNGRDDSKPRLIMDFNLIKGEKWFFDEEFEIGLVVIDKFEITSNGETYPAMAIKYINRYPTSEYKINNFSFGPTEFIVTPLNPNPIFIGNHYQKIAEAKWSIFQTNNDHQPIHWIPEIRSSDVRFISVDFQWESNQSFGHKSYPINGRAFYNL